jgi:predicted PurR-regulated permease PerM
MRQTRGSKMSEKKMVSRNVALTLGIICIILAASLVVVIAYNITTVNSFTLTDNYDLSQIASLEGQVNNLTNILNLSNSTIWVNSQTVSQGTGSYFPWIFSASYCGYISVLLQTSNIPYTSVEFTYSAYGMNYSQAQLVSAGNTAFFPILPCSDIIVEVGSGNTSSLATVTVTITYYY